MNWLQIATGSPVLSIRWYTTDKYTRGVYALNNEHLSVHKSGRASERAIAAQEFEVRLGKVAILYLYSPHDMRRIGGYNIRMRCVE